MGSKEDHLRQPFHFVCVFQECPSVSVCVYSVCAFCHLVQCFSLIPRIGQAEITPQGLVLKHFKDFYWITEDSGLVVCPWKLMIFAGITFSHIKEDGLRRKLLFPHNLQGTPLPSSSTGDFTSAHCLVPVLLEKMISIGLLYSYSCCNCPCPATKGRRRSISWLSWPSWLQLVSISHSGSTIQRDDSTIALPSRLWNPQMFRE